MSESQPQGRSWRVLVVNPGSTSTKVGLFEGERCVFEKTVNHDADELARFATVSDQLPYRRETIARALEENGVDLASVDAFVGRGGGLMPLIGGTYEIDELVLDHARNSANGIQHPAQLGSQLAHEFAVEAGGKPEFVVNPPDTDEFSDVARMTGIKGVYRHCALHALNLKETAIRHAAKLGKRYDECKFVVCHIGGGISVSAHDHGRMIDGNNIVEGEGPMTPTRCGSVPVTGILDYLEAGHTTSEVRAFTLKNGGLVSLCGTSDAREVGARADEGDAAAVRAWDAIVYQISKWIGAMACALGGGIDGILLSGGMVRSESLVAGISDRCGWIAPVTAYPGEFELEAMAAGARRVLDGEEEPRVYTGVPTWTGFDD